jgi:hypothetical protein
MTSSSTALTTILGPEQADTLECWVRNSEPEVSAALVEANAYRVNEFSRYSALQGAVGALLLRNMQPKLPRSALFYPRANLLAVSRGGGRPTEGSRMSLVGRHLFTISWAEGGPGMSWPTAYYAVWLPIRDVWIVTASDDTGEMLGFLDVALGWFPATTIWEDGVAAIITQDWTAWAADRQPGWQEVSASGRLSTETLWRCRQRAWPDGASDDSATDEVMQ